MNKEIRKGIFFIGAGVFFMLVGLGLNESTKREENIKYFFLFTGLSILMLYLGMSWKSPSYGGGTVHKYGAICAGTICGLYSIYLLIRIL